MIKDSSEDLSSFAFAAKPFWIRYIEILTCTSSLNKMEKAFRFIFSQLSLGGIRTHVAGVRAILLVGYQIILLIVQPQSAVVFCRYLPIIREKINTKL